MRIKLLTVAVVSATVLLTSGIARANWVNISTSSDRQFFLDNSNVEKRGDTFYYWEQQVFAVPLQDLVKSFTTYQSVNCVNRVIRMHRMIAYNSAGVVVADEKLSEQKSRPQEIVPGTHGDNIYKAVCSNW